MRDVLDARGMALHLGLPVSMNGVRPFFKKVIVKNNTPGGDNRFVVM
jgi:hypothetical protein